MWRWSYLEAKSGLLLSDFPAGVVSCCSLRRIRLQFCGELELYEQSARPPAMAAMSWSICWRLDLDSCLPASFTAAATLSHAECSALLSPPKDTWGPALVSIVLFKRSALLCRSSAVPESALLCAAGTWGEIAQFKLIWDSRILLWIWRLMKFSALFLTSGFWVFCLNRTETSSENSCKLGSAVDSQHAGCFIDFTEHFLSFSC